MTNNKIKLDNQGNDPSNNINQYFSFNLNDLLLFLCKNGGPNATYILNRIFSQCLSLFTHDETTYEMTTKFIEKSIDSTIQNDNNKQQMQTETPSNEPNFDPWSREVNSILKKLCKLLERQEQSFKSSFESVACFVFSKFPCIQEINHEVHKWKKEGSKTSYAFKIYRQALISQIFSKINFLASKPECFIENALKNQECPTLIEFYIFNLTISFNNSSLAQTSQKVLNQFYFNKAKDFDYIALYFYSIVSIYILIQENNFSLRLQAYTFLANIINYLERFNEFIKLEIKDKTSLSLKLNALFSLSAFEKYFKNKICTLDTQKLKELSLDSNKYPESFKKWLTPNNLDLAIKGTTKKKRDLRALYIWSYLGPYFDEHIEDLYFLMFYNLLKKHDETCLQEMKILQSLKDFYLTHREIFEVTEKSRSPQQGFKSFEDFINLLDPLLKMYKELKKLNLWRSFSDDPISPAPYLN